MKAGENQRGNIQGLGESKFSLSQPSLLYQSVDQLLRHAHAASDLRIALTVKSCEDRLGRIRLCPAGA